MGFDLGHTISSISKLALRTKRKNEKIEYEKKKKEFFCPQCGRLVKKAELRRNDGLCDQCTINSIQL